MSDSERHQFRQEVTDALTAGHPVSIPIGRVVLCDIDDTDLTDDPRSGGFLFDSYGVGPCCAQRYLATIRGYGEEGHIRGWCPPSLSFAEWIRQYRAATGATAITFTPGLPSRPR